MATVITNLASAIPFLGHDLVQLVWGSHSVDQPTLNRFFSLHYLLPFLLTALVFLHILALHTTGSNNPLGFSMKTDALRFHPYFTTKDLVGFALYAFLFFSLIFFFPVLLGEPDNNIPANSLVTPPSIVPEWYLLPFYAILRSIPNKLLGVIAMLAAILIFIPISFLHTLNLRSFRFRPLLRLLFWIFVFNFFFLLFIGSLPVADPFTFLGQLATFFYFLYFILLMIIG